MGKSWNKGWSERGTVFTRIGRHHLAFLRGYLNGLKIDEMAKRYLEPVVGPVSKAAAFAQLRWIREQLRAAAHRRGPEFKDARLISVDPEKFRAGQVKPSMTLEQFREERDPDEMYSERELVELFQEEFGGKVDRRTERNDRLRKRQLEVLPRLETLLGADPTPEDELVGWIDPVLAGRLSAAGILTVRQLNEWMNAKGFTWWDDIPLVGKKAGTEITAWMKSEYLQKATGLQLKTETLVPTHQRDKTALLAAIPRRTDLVPIERFLMPAHLSGEHGSNRSLAKCRINARNDYEAVQEWLKLREDKSQHTYRTYRKEVERYLLWSILAHGKALSDHTSADCMAYKFFLRALDPDAKHPDGSKLEWPYPFPRESWFGPEYAHRYSREWRPFMGPLSLQSQRHAVIIISSMCKWLAGQRYLDHNPWEGLPKDHVYVPRRFDRTRSFTFSQWKVLLRHLSALPRDEKYHRLRFVLFFAYATGLRLSELVRARRGDIKPVFDVEGNDNAFQIHVTGKGKRDREVPVPSRIVRELDYYLAARGEKGFAHCEPELPLITQLVRRGRPKSKENALPSPAVAGSILPHKILERKRSPMTESALHIVFKDFFAGAAASIEHLDSHTRDRFKKASAHWMRHTCGTHAVASGTPVEVIQANFGHSSIDTTAGYVEPDNLSRARAMEAFLEKRLGDVDETDAVAPDA